MSWRPTAVDLFAGAGGASLGLLAGLSDIGYEASCAEFLAAQYGAPQMRWRLIIVAWRRDLDLPSGFGFPEPTHGGRIGDLLPNVTINSADFPAFVNTWAAIGDLPVVAAGEEGTEYTGRPMPRKELHDHYWCSRTVTTALAFGWVTPRLARSTGRGPNVNNVFKRTFYQIMLRFQSTRRESSARASSSTDDRAPNWIYVFDIADEPPSDGCCVPARDSQPGCYSGGRTLVR